jgi:hypothetical protein
MKTKLLAFLSALKNDLADTYKRLKIYFFAFGVLLITFEWEKIKQVLTVWAAQREMKQTTAKDETLKVQEGALNASADALVKDANALPDSQKPVTLDWNKKK